MSEENSVQISGPFRSNELIVDGYSVPGIEPHEEDGGRVTFVVCGNFGYSVSAADFEQVARLIAHVYALGLGKPFYPGAGREDEDQWREELRQIPILMRPRRTMEIVGFTTEADG